MIYASKAYSDQWKKNDTYYEEIKPVTLLWILNYKYGKKEYLNYQMLEKKTKKKFGNNIKIKIFNLKQTHTNKILKQYQTLFNAKDEHELKPLQKYPKLKTIIKQMYLYNQDIDTYLDIQRREIMNWTIEDEIRFQTSEAVRIGRIQGEHIGLKKGEEQGQRKEKLKMAKNMLQKKFSTAIISEITGLPEQQIKNINHKKKISF